VSARGNAQDKGAFWLAFAWTAFPIVLVSVVSTAGAADDGLYFLWFVGVVLGLIAPLAAIGFAFAHKGRVASGILAGFGVGVLALALTCFANLSTLDF
jgi:hypothetical protein